MIYYFKNQSYRFILKKIVLLGKL